jgi:SET domain-containing protein
MADIIQEIEKLHRDRLLMNLKKNSNVYLAPSTVCKGVGVFALIPIKQGSKLFADVKPKKYHVSYKELEVELVLDSRVIDKLKSLCHYDEHGIFLPSSLNNFDFSYFVNHSTNSNVFHHINDDTYYTIRDISAEEEILCNYPNDEMDWL